ncbi:hypothetical protein KY284_024208 [Solanum tuberosum]|nr:hypothetical protein KY284_024208 [Solanum tuberosum]
MRGAMMCPNCLVDEGGKWIRCGDVEDDDDDDYNNTNDDENNNNMDEFYGEDSFLSEEENDHRATAEAGGSNNMRQVTDSNDSRTSAPSTTLQLNNDNGRNITMNESSILQQNEWIQQLSVPPPPIAPAMGSNVGSNEQARNNLLPCLELTLATHNSSSRMH